MTEINIKKSKSFLILGLSSLFASTSLAEDVNNFSNAAGEEYILSENLNATGSDATNYGTFVVEGTGLTITAEANFANRNGEAEFRVNANSNLTILVKEGFWNESYGGDGSGLVNLLEGSSLFIGNSENNANFTNNNDAIVNIASGATLGVSGALFNNGNAQINLSSGANLDVTGEFTLSGTSKVSVTDATIKNAGGLYFAADEGTSSSMTLENSTLETKEFVVGRWASERVESSLTLVNSTVKSTNDSSSRGTMNVSGNTSILFENDITETTDEGSGETTTQITYRTFTNNGTLDISEGSRLKIDANLSNSNDADIRLADGATIEVSGNLSLDGTSRFTATNATIENSNGSLSFGGTASASLILNNSVLNTGSFSSGVWWEGKNDSYFEISNSTINASGNGTNWANIKVSGESSINFNNVIDEESGEISSYYELANNGNFDIETGSTFKVNGKFSNSNEALLNVNSGANLDIANEFWINGTSVVNLNEATVKTGASTYFAQEASSVLNLNKSTLETSSFVIGLWASNKVNSVLNLTSSTIYTAGDSTSWGTINVKETSSIVFGESGRALFNRGDITIKSDQSLDISRVREEGGDDSYFCNYGTITVEAATNSEALAAISVQNFVDDGNAGIIIIDFSNITGMHESQEYALISANSLSVDSTEFKYTVDGITFKDIELGSQVEDGKLFLELIQNGAEISYIYSIVPEPATYAAIFAVLSLTLACYRRRKNK